jgi:hypothetical protein
MARSEIYRKIKMPEASERSKYALVGSGNTLPRRAGARSQAQLAGLAGENRAI